MWIEIDARDLAEVLAWTAYLSGVGGPVVAAGAAESRFAVQNLPSISTGLVLNSNGPALRRCVVGSGGFRKTSITSLAFLVTTTSALRSLASTHAC